MKHRAVFLDRDGVLNRAIVRDGKPYPPDTTAELEVLPGVREALTRLRAGGFRLLVATNQPDVARGKQTRAAVESMHARLLEAGLALDGFYVCYHDSGDGCSCRKPKPGLLLAAAGDHNIDLGASFMVGDRWRDVSAGQQAGCMTFFIDYAYSEPQPTGPFVRVRSLSEAAEWILGSTASHRTDL